MTFQVTDRRGDKKETNAEACRVCGSKDVHTQEYSKPTMACIEYLRDENSKLKKENEALTTFAVETKALIEKAKRGDFDPTRGFAGDPP